jgi:CHAT domain-containing protein
VPWDALRLGDGRYAVERYAIGIAPSAALATALWRRARARPPSSAPTRLLAFGDPVFASDGPGRTLGTYQAAFAAAGGLPRLEGSGREVRAIARYAPIADVRLREAASESSLERSSLTGYRILHFATHALVDDRVSVRTALALAPGGGADGFVTPGELARLRLAADLVVLSACHTGGGGVVDGEGVQGLTAPLLEAGARAVLATTWRVGDERTIPLIDRFYAGLARGLPVSEALRAAKLEALRGGAGVGVWGAFTVVGDPFVTVPLRRPGPSR